MLHTESSLVRHAKKCTLEPTPSLRQKACTHCTTAKARCDLQRPSCSRCLHRGNPCVYVRPVKPTEPGIGRRSGGDVGRSTGNGAHTATPADALSAALVGTPLSNSSLGGGGGSSVSVSVPGLCNSTTTTTSARSSTGGSAAPTPAAAAYHASDHGYLIPELSCGSVDARGGGRRGVGGVGGDGPMTPSGHLFSSTNPSVSGDHPGAMDLDMAMDQLSPSLLALPDVTSHSHSHSQTQFNHHTLPLPLPFPQPQPHHHNHMNHHQHHNHHHHPHHHLAPLSPLPPPPPPHSQPSPSSVEDWLLELAARPVVADPPALLDHSMRSIFRLFRTWPGMLAKGFQLPPIMHSFQFLPDGTPPRPLANCIMLCKMWVGVGGGGGGGGGGRGSSLEGEGEGEGEDGGGGGGGNGRSSSGRGSGGGDIIAGAVRKEIESILKEYRTFDAPTLLAALQSAVVLLLLLLWPDHGTRTSVGRVGPALFEQVQHMAYYVASTGMVLHEESTHVRPSWRAWAHVEAKRRSMLALYLVHWAYGVYHAAAHYDCLELGRQRSPGPKYLWQAADERAWESLYTRWLAQWDGREPVLAEFFLVDRDPVMPRRMEMWLEDADELGVVLMGFVNANERGTSHATPAQVDVGGSRCEPTDPQLEELR
ncbi:hypothetical protein F4778DRAFT_505289 [Xylariomycetidae sp. FL2044]|nr:hypothetical protein F4778DRAFT_505289 [Xylariomycetidae sp. FL2044]